ncbi:MAG: hypothetical protein C0615_06095 [Desulfuromonas sp.]|nr:MAG: hypothetical protein C0615_06095 [Desulfuromonas sp.]
MVGKNDIVAIFHSMHKVMKAEKVLKREGVTMLLIPVPRQLTSDCGLAIRYAVDDQAHVEEILNKEDLFPLERFRKGDDGFTQIGEEG